MKILYRMNYWDDLWRQNIFLGPFQRIDNLV